MPRNPDTAIGADIPASQMRNDLAPNRFDQTSAHTGPQQYALSSATVAAVDHENFTVTLITESGETFRRIPYPLTFPGAGARHFLGSLPEPGDVCVVGWGMQESGRTRQPIVLGWLLPGAVAGQDWLPTQFFSADEHDMTPKSQHELEGIYDRQRHKLRHMEPGNIVASSSQGADLVLNESAMLMNRRGNEIHLRDQDQAIIVRSLQQFHAGAGFRVYGGMVQRDATFLPTQMFSDGTDWASSRQVDGEKTALPEDALDASEYDDGALTPGQIFQRDGDGSPQTSIHVGVEADPYEFLQNGLFIDSDGFATGNVRSDAIYGGKPMFRVSTDATNGVIDNAADTFTEYRIEVAHTSNGTLPVTEQTDGFDADRLPTGPPPDTEKQNAGEGGIDTMGASSNSPFLEWVLGTVVGNDPFTDKGQRLYGMPMRPVIFDGEIRSPAMVTALGTPLGTHAASLFRIAPPTGGTPSFVSSTKDGRLLASLVGPIDTWSAEVAFGAGLRMGSGTEPGGESLNADMDGSVTLRARRGRNADNMGVLITSDEGAVKIYAGGTSQEGGIAARTAPSGTGEAAMPGVIVESGTNALIKAVGTLTLSANQLNLENISSMRFGANSSLDFKSGAGISHSSDTYTQSSTGRSTYNYSGPKDSLPTNGPLRKESFTGSPATGFAGGTADEYELLYGDREETITAGNHETNVLVGNMTYATEAGLFTAKSGPQCSMELSSGSLSGRSPTLSFQATGGAATLQASAALTMQGSTASVNAPNVTIDGGHTPPGGTPGGGILTDGVLDPITGQTFQQGGVFGVSTVRVN